LKRWWSVVNWQEAGRRYERSGRPALGKPSRYPWVKQTF